MFLARDPAGAPAPIGPGWRALGLAAGWALFCLAGPGVLRPDGNALGLVGVALWAAVARRPGRYALRLEWLAAAIGLASQLWWIGYVFPLAMVYVVAGCGVYGVCTGLLLRRLSRRFRPVIAVPAAWIGMETLRTVLPPPIGLSWLSLGHYALDLDWLAGSARVWGAVGLGFVLASIAGLTVELLEWRRRLRPGPDRWSALFGLGPALIGMLLAALTAAPRMVDGPRLLLVQPAFPQERKQSAGAPRDLYLEQLRMSLAGIAAERAAGRGAPDLVAWGETMLMVMLAEDGLKSAAEAGLEFDPWWGLSAQDLPELVDKRLQHEAEWVTRTLFEPAPDGAALLPAGTSFLSGAELLVARDGRLRRMNAIGLWGPDGARRGLAAKTHLAPGGETMVGLERFAFVRAYIQEVAGYVPDFLPAEGTGVLELPTRAGRSYRFGATICFDNAFPQAYAQPLAEGPLDFHLVVSNEAWYLESCEMDQMMAFSRLEALATGRAMVRATNAGISALIGPRGEVLERLVVDGSDRLVTGVLAVTVPVPAAEDARRPPYVRLWRWWYVAALLLPAFLALIAGRRMVTEASAEVSADHRPGGGSRA